MVDCYMLKYLLLIDSGLDEPPIINSRPPVDGKLKNITKPPNLAGGLLPSSHCPILGTASNAGYPTHVNYSSSLWGLSPA